jgi:hypothetical protein
VINTRKVIEINFTITVPSQTCPSLFEFIFINTKSVFTTSIVTPVNHYVSLVADSYHQQRLHHLN